MGFVDGNEGELALGEHFRKAGDAEALGGDEEELERAREVVHAGLSRGRAVEAGVDARHAQAKRGELGRLVFHERDERRDDQRRASARDGRELVTEGLPCPGGHDEEQIAAGDGGAADRLLARAKAGKAEDRLQQVGEGNLSRRRRIGGSGSQ